MKNENQIPGQLEIDIKSATPAPPVVKTTIQKDAKKNYVPGEALTEEDRKRMTATELENYQNEKDVAFLKKAKEESERVKKIRKARNAQAGVMPEENQNDVPDVDDDICEDETNEFPSKKTSKQSNVCRKYGIKRRELRRGIERARELFVPKMFPTEKQKVILAIIDLLEFGDI